MSDSRIQNVKELMKQFTARDKEIRDIARQITMDKHNSVAMGLQKLNPHNPEAVTNMIIAQRRQSSREYRKLYDDLLATDETIIGIRNRIKSMKLKFKCFKFYLQGTAELLAGLGTAVIISGITGIAGGSIGMIIDGLAHGTTLGAFTILGAGAGISLGLLLSKVPVQMLVKRGLKHFSKGFADYHKIQFKNVLKAKTCLKLKSTKRKICKPTISSTTFHISENYMPDVNGDFVYNSGVYVEPYNHNPSYKGGLSPVGPPLAHPFQPAQQSSQTTFSIQPAQQSSQAVNPFQLALQSPQAVNPFQPTQQSSQTTFSFQPAQQSSQAVNPFQPAQQSPHTTFSFQPAQQSSRTIYVSQPTQQSPQTVNPFQPAQQSPQTTYPFQPAQQSSQTTFSIQPAQQSSQAVNPFQPAQQSSQGVNPFQPTRQSPQAVPGYRKCYALKNRDAQNANELSLRTGNYIQIEKEADGWCLGTNTRGERGIFPKANVLVIPWDTQL